MSSLWDEAQTALAATQISLRDSQAQASVFRYTRTLEPRALGVLQEVRSANEGMLERPFVSLSGDSLSKFGYCQEFDNDVTLFHAPDANAMLSEAFLRDHCFSLAPSERRRQAMIGLAFEPVAGRRVPDIRGTMWLDARSFELKIVEYRYARMPRSASDNRMGGEVWFALLPTGAWIVRRWFIRMPQFANIVPLTDAALGLRGGGVTRRTAQMHRVIEEGGNVFAEGTRFYTKPAFITALMLDSAGQPLRGARVELGGSPFRTTSDAQGRFWFDSLPSGSYTLLAHHDEYDLLGQLAADVAVDLAEGETARVTLRAKATHEILARLCEQADKPKPGSAVLRVLFRQRETGGPLAGVPVHLYWLGGREKASGIQGLTDASGAYDFCGVPADTRLYIRVLLRTLAPGPIAALCGVGKHQIAVRLVRTTVPTVAASEQFQADTSARTERCQAPVISPDSAVRLPERRSGRSVRRSVKRSTASRHQELASA